ncbi:MAG: hypothetical protein QW350_05805 [Candidatus Aenigmatarchaeota archaeon]|jgi:hypothetical protein
MSISLDDFYDTNNLQPGVINDFYDESSSSSCITSRDIYKGSKKCNKHCSKKCSKKISKSSKSSLVLPVSIKSSSSSSTSSSSFCHCEKKDGNIYKVIRYSSSAPNIPCVPLTWYKFNERTYISIVWSDNSQLIKEWSRVKSISSRIILHNSCFENINITFTLFLYYKVNEKDYYHVLSADIKTINSNSFETFNVEWQGNLSELFNDITESDIIAFFTDVTSTDHNPHIGYLETIAEIRPKIHIEY